MANETQKKLKFLFVAIESLSGDLAWQLIKEGHDVKMYLKVEGDKEVFDGFVPKVDKWEPHVDWADVIVFDDVGWGKEAEQLRKSGKYVVGGSLYTDRLENDREFGQEEMKRMGLVTLPNQAFTSFDTAITFLKANPARYVFKPSGSASNEKDLLFIGEEEDGRDILEVLEHNKKAWSKKIKTFQLQRYADGVEVAVGTFFNGKEFVTPVCVNFEHKRMFPGDIGPLTGEMGTLMYWSPPNTLFKETLARMQKPLAESGYVGYVDINTITNGRGIYPLEFTCRFGYPTISIQSEGALSPWGEFLYGIAKGEMPELRTRRGFQVGVVIAVPPFPFDDKDTLSVYKESTILFKKESRDGMHLGDVKIVDGDWQLAGNSGYALVVTGAGTTVDEARRQAYNRIKNIMLQNMFYRTDIGDRWSVDSDKLQTWGYLY
ncbi:phosphoribosylamine--glycine ligase [Candidatus Uhrbacteria bacterium]|nr:phosphoribosylamine--glycine ligase [Candidatus Uhrbacteria bacterium]